MGSNPTDGFVPLPIKKEILDDGDKDRLEDTKRDQESRLDASSQQEPRNGKSRGQESGQVSEVVASTLGLAQQEPSSPMVAVKVETGLEVTPAKIVLASGRKRRLLRKTSLDEVKHELWDPIKSEPGVQSVKEEKEEWPTDVKTEDVKDEMIEAKEELSESESESVKPEDVKDELYEQVKDEIKEEVKEELDEDEELYDSSEVKSEVKDECKEEVKQEPGVYDSDWIKSECKEEFITKVKKEPTIKREPPDGFSEASRPLPFKRRRINVKSEPTEFGAGVSSPLASPPPPLFTKMLPGWIQDCIDFQKAHRTWSPARPCCPANYFLSEMGPPLPPNEGQKMQSCYHRLTKPQQREFRRYIESGEEDHAVLAKLAAENAVARPASKGSCKEPGAYMWPWMRDLKLRLRAGLAADGSRRLQDMGGCDAIAGTQMWESRAARAPEEAIKPSSLLVPGATEAIAYTAGQASGGASHGSEVRAASASATSSGKPVRIVARQSKQSGIPGVSWLTVDMGWRIQYRDQKDANKPKCVYFIVKRYSKPGISWEEADEAALLAAKATREDLVKRGNMKDTLVKLSKAKFTSAVLGVTWSEPSKSWTYRLRDQSVRPNKIFGSGSVKAKDTSEAGIFRARAEAEEKMNELYDKHGLPRQIWGADKEVKSASELVKRESSVPCVTWKPTEGCWHAQVWVNSKRVQRRCRPQDETPEEVERCFKECVTALGELRDRKAREEKPKK
ncbi:unnamed protein product [Polarella glacialis]|nr:unnamed protein product [Polarella glacialis]